MNNVDIMTFVHEIESIWMLASLKTTEQHMTSARLPQRPTLIVKDVTTVGDTFFRISHIRALLLTQNSRLPNLMQTPRHSLT